MSAYIPFVSTAMWKEPVGDGGGMASTRLDRDLGRSGGKQLGGGGIWAQVSPGAGVWAQGSLREGG